MNQACLVASRCAVWGMSNHTTCCPWALQIDGWNRYTIALPGADASRQKCAPSDVETECVLQPGPLP
eukprot:COSAG06_NODE_54774_length_293_cov_0.469072_1_plen_66_part_10